MQKYITFISLVTFLFFGLNTISAQDKNEINELSTNTTISEDVKLKSESLRSMLNLNEKQIYSVLKVLEITEPKKAKISTATYQDKYQRKRDLQSVLDYENSRFEKILSESQFKLYKELLIKGQ